MRELRRARLAHNELTDLGAGLERRLPASRRDGQSPAWCCAEQ